MIEKIKCNLHTNKYYEIELKNINNKNQLNTISGVYILYDKLNIYVGKSINTINRLMDHRNQILKKTHYNKNMLKFKVKDTKCLIIPCKNIDLYERYYINKFKNKLNMTNIIYPHIKESITYYDYSIKPIIKLLRNNNKKIFYSFLYNEVLKKAKYKDKFETIRKDLLEYFIIINTLGDIEKFEHSRSTKTLYFKMKNTNYTIGILKYKKVIKDLKKVDIKCIIDNDEYVKYGIVKFKN